MNQLKSTLLLFLIIITSNLAYSQYTDAINSNRPGVSQSAYAVGTNVIQFELGPYMIKEERIPKISHKVSGFGGDFSLRYGLLLENLEINMDGTYQNDTKTIPYNNSIEDRANFKNLTLGAKYLLYDPFKNAEEKNKPNVYSWKANHKFKWHTIMPAVALFAGANYDIKNNPYVDTGVEGFSPKVMLITQNNFNSGWVLVMNFIGDRIGTEQFDLSGIFTLSYSITPRWGMFGETQIIKSDFYSDNLLRFGGAYILNKDMQIDSNIVFNTKDTPAVFGVNLGFSYRLDLHEVKSKNGWNAIENSLKGNKKKKR